MKSLLLVPALLLVVSSVDAGEMRYSLAQRRGHIRDTASGDAFWELDREHPDTQVIDEFYWTGDDPTRVHVGDRFELRQDAQLHFKGRREFAGKTAVLTIKSFDVTTGAGNELMGTIEWEFSFVDIDGTAVAESGSWVNEGSAQFRTSTNLLVLQLGDSMGQLGSGIALEMRLDMMLKGVATNPEPGTIILSLLGLGGLGAVRRRRKSA